MQHFKFSMMVCACVLGLTITARADDNAAQAAARAAVLAQLSQSNATTPPPAAPAPKPVQPAPVAIAPVVVPPAAPVATTTDGDNAAQAAARAALAQHPALATPSIAPVAPVIMVQPVQPVMTNPAPVMVPVAPNTKEGRLQALNAQYRAGQITPLDYFNQREAILNSN